MRHDYFDKQSQKPSERNGLNLEGYINLDTERITRSRVLFHGIRFILDKESLQDIQQAQQTGRHLHIPRQLLTDLRYYTLIDGENRLQSALTFCTYYQRGEFKEALIRSVISIDGDIVHQIKRDCLERPNFCRKIAAAHYWLIEQLLEQLRLGAFVKLESLFKWFSWGLALLIVVLMVIPFIPEFLNNPWMVFAPLLMAWLLQWGFYYLFRLFSPAIRSWIWRRILSGLLSPKPGSKQMAKRILMWLVP